MKNIFRLLIGIPVISSLIISASFIVAGVIQIVKGISGVLAGQLKTEEHPGLKLFEALELFLFGMLFIIFAMGFSKLFMPKSKLSDAIDDVMPDWFRKVNFTHLKLILWETLLTTMLIFFLGLILKNLDGLYWELTILPISITLVTVAIFLIKSGEKDHH